MDRIPFSLQLIRSKLKSGCLRQDQQLNERVADTALNAGGRHGWQTCSWRSCRQTRTSPIGLKHSTTGNNLQMMLKKHHSQETLFCLSNASLKYDSLLKSISINHLLSCYFDVMGLIMLRALTCRLSMLQTHKKWVSLRRPKAADVSAIPSFPFLTDKRMPNWLG